MGAALEDWLEDGALQKTDTGYAVTELFFWYEDDFTYWSDADNLCQYLCDCTSEDAADWLYEHYEDCPLERIPYDWRLNAAPEGECHARPGRLGSGGADGGAGGGPGGSVPVAIREDATVCPGPRGWTGRDPRSRGPRRGSRSRTECRMPSRGGVG